MDCTKYVFTSSGEQADLQAVVTDCLQPNNQHHQVWSIVRIIIYLLSFSLDSYASYRLFADGDIYWGTLTLLLIIIPIILVDLFVIYWEIYCVPKLLAPFIPLLLMVRAAVATSKGINETFVARYVTEAEGTAIFVAGMQCLPQASLQLYIIARTLGGGGTVGIWQWIVVATALVSFAATLFASTHLFANIPCSSRVVFFLFSLMSTFSRLIVICLYSLIALPLALLPLAIIVIASIIMWVIQSSRNLYIPKAHWITQCMIYVGTWALTTFCNCFTLPGFLISTLNFLFAIGAAVHWWSLYGLWGTAPVDIATFYMLAIISSGITFLVNIIIIAVPGFKCIRIHWVGKSEDGKTFLF